MNNLLSYIKNKINFGKGIVQNIQPNKFNQNFIYKEKIKSITSHNTYIYSYGYINEIKYNILSKEILPFQIINNNNKLNINCNNIDIYYIGKKIKKDNIITYEINNNTSVYYLIINNKYSKKIMFYLL
jgi:hypothetical protein